MELGKEFILKNLQESHESKFRKKIIFKVIILIKKWYMGMHYFI